MMKIGIMSMQRVANYGSFLQAYALKRMLEKMGNEVVFVDFVSEKPENEVSRRRKLPHIKTLFSLLSRKKRRVLLASRRLNARFTNEFIPFLGVVENTYGTKCDLLVIGSDQVFSCATLHDEKGQYYRELFGHNANAERVISYAASFGSTTIDYITEKMMASELGESLREFTAISVRDKNSVDIIESLVGVSPEVHLDPVLIYDFEGEIEKEKKLSDYILIYAYGKRISNEEARTIQKFARKKKLKTVCIYGMYEWCDIQIVPTPFEALAMFKYADYVITDTFHGTVISIKYNKKFATFVRKNVSNGGETNQNKLIDLLETFELENRSVQAVSDLETIIERDINYDLINDMIREQQLKTYRYLGEYCI